MEEKIIRSAILAHGSNKSFRFELREELKPKQIDNAIRAYAKGVTAAEVIALLDETMLSNGKKGYLVTEKGIYSSTMFNKKCNPLPLDHMVSVEVEESDCIVTYEDGTKRSFFFSIHKEFPEILRTILESGGQNVCEPEKPAEAAEPPKAVEPPKPVEPPKLTEPAKAVEPPKQAESPKPVEKEEPAKPKQGPVEPKQEPAEPKQEPAEPEQEEKQYKIAVVGEADSGRHTLVERLLESGDLSEDISLIIFENPLELFRYLEEPGAYLNGYIGVCDATIGTSDELTDAIRIMSGKQIPLSALFFNKRDLFEDDEMFLLSAQMTLGDMEDMGFDGFYQPESVEILLGRLYSVPVYIGSAVDIRANHLGPEFGNAVRELVLALNAHEGILPDGEMEPVSLEELISRYQA